MGASLLRVIFLVLAIGQIFCGDLPLLDRDSKAQVYQEAELWLKAYVLACAWFLPYHLAQLVIEDAVFETLNTYETGSGAFMLLHPRSIPDCGINKPILVNQSEVLRFIPGRIRPASSIASMKKILPQSVQQQTVVWCMPQEKIQTALSRLLEEYCGANLYSISSHASQLRECVRNAKLELFKAPAVLEYGYLVQDSIRFKLLFFLYSNGDNRITVDPFGLTGYKPVLYIPSSQFFTRPSEHMSLDFIRYRRTVLSTLTRPVSNLTDIELLFPRPPGFTRFHAYRLTGAWGLQLEPPADLPVQPQNC